MIYSCCDELRRTVVRQTAGWNGIDFLEVIDHAAANEGDRQRFLAVHFVKALGALACGEKYPHRRRRAGTEYQSARRQRRQRRQRSCADRRSGPSRRFFALPFAAG